MASYTAASDPPAAHGSGTIIPSCSPEMLGWADVRHSALPLPGEPVDYGQWLLEHAEESLLLYGILDVPVLASAAAAALAAETRRMLASAGRADDRVGSMHKYATEVESCHDALVAEMAGVLAPIIDMVFLSGCAPSVAPPAGASAGSLRRPHSAHAIGYGTAGARKRTLKLHVDDSDITINLCLGTEDFTGSELSFAGWQPVTWPAVAAAQRRLHRDPTAADKELQGVRPRAGRALIHRGSFPHRTSPITGGERFNWVLWFHEHGIEPARRPALGALGAASADSVAANVTVHTSKAAEDSGIGKA
jgi:hypothetical protein